MARCKMLSIGVERASIRKVVRGEKVLDTHSDCCSSTFVSAIKLKLSFTLAADPTFPTFFFFLLTSPYSIGAYWK